MTQGKMFSTIIFAVFHFLFKLVLKPKVIESIVVCYLSLKDYCYKCKIHFKINSSEFNENLENHVKIHKIYRVLEIKSIGTSKFYQWNLIDVTMLLKSDKTEILFGCFKVVRESY